MSCYCFHFILFYFFLPFSNVCVCVGELNAYPSLHAYSSKAIHMHKLISIQRKTIMFANDMQMYSRVQKCTENVSKIYYSIQTESDCLDNILTRKIRILSVESLIIWKFTTMAMAMHMHAYVITLQRGVQLRLSRKWRDIQYKVHSKRKTSEKLFVGIKL